MPKISLHSFVASPLGRILLFLVFVVAVMSGLWLLRRNKEPIRDGGRAVLRQTKDYIYSGKVSEFQSDRSEETPDDGGKVSPPPSAPVRNPRPAPVRTPPGVMPSRVPRRADVSRPASRAPSVPPPAPSRPKAPEAVLPICLYVKSSPSGSTTIPDGTDIAPYGRLLRCELANTISTSSLQTPVIALVTESLWWNGVEIIPAGIEVHGTVSGKPARNRIGTGTEWTLVYPFRDERSAYQMQLRGIALDCNRGEHSWAKSDGSAGIRGIVKGNGDSAKAAAYVASFISGLGSGMTSTTTEYIGGTTEKSSGGTWRDSLGQALETSFQKMSSDLLAQASKDVTYVEAQAGTEFYIYVQQIIDPAQAARGKMPAGSGRLTQNNNQGSGGASATQRRTTRRVR